MSVPGDVIYDGKEFDMKLEAKPAATSQPLKSINGKITWTQTGTGTLTIVACPEMTAGVQICRMRYAAGLTAGQAKVVKLQARHEATNETASEIYTVSTQTFAISMPARVTVGALATVTVTAIDPFGNTNTAYSGTVIPYLTLMPGRPSVDEIGGFVNGVATTQIRIFKPAWQMQIIVYDSTNSNFTGTSNTFRVIQNDEKYVGLDLIAIPRTATENRLSWTTLDSTVVSAYKIYRKDANGVYQLLYTENSVSTSYYRDQGLTTGQNYDYKVEALDSGGSTVSIDFASSTPKACTTVTSATVFATPLTKAQSPYCGTISITLTAPLIIEPGVVIMWNGGTAWSANNQTIQAIGTPREKIIITSSSATPAGGDFPGFTVTTSSGTVFDASGNFQSGSLWRYVVLEYGAGAYWQASTYAYQSFIWRYLSSGFVFENSSVTLDGGAVVRNSTDFSSKGPQTSKLNNLIFYRNSGISAGAYFIKTDVASSAYSHKVTGNYFALNFAAAGSLLPGGALTLDPQAPSTTAVGGTYQITDNQFYYNSNQAQGYNGGAIRAGIFGTPNYTISNNTFIGNSSVNGGAISIENASGYTMTMNNNIFQQNSATTNGGGVRVAGGSAAMTAINNQFVSNTASSGKNLHNGVGQNHNLQNSYWDGNTDTTCGVTERGNLGVADSCGGGGAGTVTLTGAAGTQYALCINDPAVSGCVGAR